VRITISLLVDHINVNVELYYLEDRIIAIKEIEEERCSHFFQLFVYMRLLLSHMVIPLSTIIMSPMLRIPTMNLNFHVIEIYI